MLALTRKALEKARSGGGPTLIEAFTYRMGNHTPRTTPPATGRKPSSPNGPGGIRSSRFRLYLKGKGLWDDAFESRVQKEAEDLISRSVEEAENVPPPRPEDLFVHTYKDMTPSSTTSWPNSKNS